MAESGYRVALVGRRPEPLDRVKDEITAGGGRAETISADVGSPDGAESAVAATLEAFGRLDALICNHGVGASAPVGDDTPEGWDSTLRINLTGPFLLARAAIPHLIASRGSIVNVSSTNGCQAGPGWASYDVSKAGVIMLTRSLANEYGPQGVRANCVCPGFIDTPLIEPAIDLFKDDATRWAMVPMGRAGTAEEMAYAVLYLASDESSYCTGTALLADGGCISRSFPAAG